MKHPTPPASPEPSPRPPVAPANDVRASRTERSETPRTLLEWIRRQQDRGNVDRYELLGMSTVKGARFIEDFEPTEGGGAPEQIADLVYARAKDDSENSPEYGSIHYALRVKSTHGEGAQKNFVVPTPTRTDARPVEPPTQEGIVAVGMRALNKAAEQSNILTMELARQVGAATERSEIGWKALVGSQQDQQELLTENFTKQIAWATDENGRLRARITELEKRDAQSIEIREALNDKKHEHQVEQRRIEGQERRKNDATMFLLHRFGPHLANKFESLLGLGPGTAESAHANTPATSDASASTNVETFSPRELQAIGAFLTVMGAEEIQAIDRALEGSRAQALFHELVKTIFEESARRENLRTAATPDVPASDTNGVHPQTNGAPS